MRASICLTVKCLRSTSSRNSSHVRGTFLDLGGYLTTYVSDQPLLGCEARYQGDSLKRGLTPYKG